ncbi:MarR family winged helix-turn-helix transcriptional regulator [Streptomyces turgidiscabies]|uniref:Transcriptional regulator, MarR family n=1 Tax=Streptomyces turgidiscabies (strain Car8) TaxID=698760 RepID=L7FGF5_STRT8|nr:MULTISPECIES: MarR family transcriptional regulator [Streptomyces]ELP70269.1 transcriptional regulator, MarR family [Streptomyces turgidiscabies Car8]MDX3494429.1 MarR family transcriptional regulator [Streptomyces turgidiscabies]GAQ74708.1 HTH-type transcriptional repressor NicR [Streptomyces turgidiscabies]
MAEAADRDPAPDPDPESHEGPLTIYLVKQLELAIRSFMDEALRPFRLTTFQYTALTVLQHRGRLSSAQLARRSFVRPQTMHEIVRSLEERGLIERAHAPGNRRIMEARLTREGEDLLAACAPTVQKLEDRLLHGMPDKRRSAFRQGLEDGLASLTGRHHG